MPYADEGLWVETQLITRTRIIERKQVPYDCDCPTFDDTIVNRIDTIVSTSKRVKIHNKDVS